MNRIGHLLAGTAIFVQAPRLVLTILAADRLPVHAGAVQLLLTVAGIGTAVVLTGGGIYLAHAALTAPRWRMALGIAWLLVLTASAGLVAPAIVGGLADKELHQVIDDTGLRTAWALLAAIGHEITAAGCMLAAAANSATESREDFELRLYAERQTAFERAERAERELSALASTLSPAASELDSQPKIFPCEHCERSFHTKQARSGHQRSCPGRSAALTRAQPQD